MSPRIPTAVAAVLASVLGVAPSSRAGTTITAHQMSLSIKVADQNTNSSSDFKIVRNSQNQKDLFFACVGTTPTKTQSLYVFFDCAGPPPGTATILAIDTQPLTRLATVGSIDFGTPLLKNTKSNGTVVTSIKVPATITIDCGGGPTMASVSGILNLNYSAFPNQGPVCPVSGTMKITGEGSTGSKDSIVDDGSSVKINTRNGGITVIPGS